MRAQLFRYHNPVRQPASLTATLFAREIAHEVPMIASHGYAAHDSTSPLSAFKFNRRDPGPHDILIDIDYAGICHSDIHQARDEWGGSIYPMVPGHEIVGHVAKAGAAVKKFKEGDRAAVGVFVDSCGKCPNCLALEQPYCEQGAIGTYNAKDYSGNPTYGGYSNNIVVKEDFAYTFAASLDPAAVAPLLCAGITTYSPLRHWKVGPGMKVGIVGLGGLGHMALKFAHHFGAHVVLFTTSPNKAADAKRLGADEVVISKNPDEMAAQKGKLDFVLDAVAAPHDLDQMLSVVKLNGTYCMVGLPDKPVSIHPFSIVTNRRSFAGSMVGGNPQVQEMLDLCADHNITADIELTTFDQLPQAWDRVIKGDVKYRFVLDLKSLKP